MVLVTESWRRRGIATNLVDACLNAATKLGLTTWLDATPAGANVYGPLGFTPTLQLRRLRLEAPKGISAAQTLSTCSIADFIARDVRAMGFDRGALLTEFGGRAGSRTVSLGNTVALVRDGRTARHIGPVFAETHDGALALVDAIGKLDTRHQRALSRYYIDSGAGGLAVGVHTTQFAIRDVGLYKPVLELAAQTAADWTKRPLAMVAGLAGPTQQAIAEAQIARGIGYHAGLLSLAAMKSTSEDE